MKADQNSTFLIIYAHPEPKSFCGAIKDQVISVLLSLKKEVLFSDLYEMQFNPCISSQDFLHLAKKEKSSYISLEQEQKKSSESNSFDPQISNEIEKIMKADFLIFIAPLFWGSVPAILKGWFDRVLVRGKIWDVDKWYDTGILKGKKALLILTSASKIEDFQPGNNQNNTIDNLLHHLTWTTLKFCGLTVLKPYLFYEIGIKTREKHQEDLVDLENFLKKQI